MYSKQNKKNVKYPEDKTTMRYGFGPETANEYHKKMARDILLINSSRKYES